MPSSYGPLHRRKRDADEFEFDNSPIATISCGAFCPQPQPIQRQRERPAALRRPRGNGIRVPAEQDLAEGRLNGCSQMAADPGPTPLRLSDPETPSRMACGAGCRAVGHKRPYQLGPRYVRFALDGGWPLKARERPQCADCRRSGRSSQPRAKVAREEERFGACRPKLPPVPQPRKPVLAELACIPRTPPNSGSQPNGGLMKQSVPLR